MQLTRKSDLDGHLVQRLQKIISGGQTGADRGALEAAVKHGIAHGGWCPKGRRSEDGAIPLVFCLIETKSACYDVRTRLNVQQADGTLVVTPRAPSGGTALTIKFADRFNKPCLVIDPADSEAATKAAQWIEHFNIKILNVAGPRESEAPGLHQQTYQLLCNVVDQSNS